MSVALSPAPIGAAIPAAAPELTAPELTAPELAAPQTPKAPRTDPRGKPLSADAWLLYDLIATGGDWNVATLDAAAGMPWPRLANALVDLECSRLVSRDVMGFFSVRDW